MAATKSEAYSALVDDVEEDEDEHQSHSSPSAAAASASAFASATPSEGLKILHQIDLFYFSLILFFG